MRRLEWEHVSAYRHPEYYQGDNPQVRPEQVPDEHWEHLRRQDTGLNIAVQAEGLLGLVARGELIRNVRMFEAEIAEPTWREVTP